MSNKNMNKAKKLKNDEFYTQLSDIENELCHYDHHFEEKSIYCNCDAESSHFYTYFNLNFDYLKLKKLVITNYSEKETAHKIEMFRNENGQIETIKSDLSQNGDFRSSESIANLEECDVVVTNPPFSLFREFVAQLMEYDKKFVIVGNKNAITYKETFELIKENKLWLGYTSPKEFIIPNGENTKRISGLTRWFTNLERNVYNTKLILNKKYYGNEDSYPKYDNYDVINVNKVKDIPCDYDGIMGVPITFLDKFNSEQFEILGLDNHTVKYPKLAGRNSINGQKIYRRFIIKKHK